MTYTAYIFLVSLSISNVLSIEVPKGLLIEGIPPKKIKAVKNNEDAQISLDILKNESKKSPVENEPLADEHRENEPLADEHRENEKGSKKKELKTIMSDDINKLVQNNSNVHTPEESSSIDSFKSPNIGSDAVMRGVLVFAGIGMLFLVYVGCKTYRRKKPNILVRKYGVRTRRSDVEMTPLPLDEDEEDETLFDLGSLNRT